ncbi:MAG: phosphoglucosamine mutase, partial [Actinomycetota bacterium]
MVMIRFGTDGIRGRVGTEITAEVAYAVGRAAADVVAADGRLALACDTRESGDLLARAVVAGAASSGARVVYLGVVPTPVLASVTVRAGMPGCMITASHNPYHDNGLKLFNARGLKLDPAEEQAVEAAVNRTMEGLTLDPSALVGLDVDATAAELVDAYAADVIAPLAEVDLSGFRVGFDFANGAGSYLGPRLFDQVKLASVHYVGNEPTGTNINDGAGSTAPEAMTAAVVEHGLDLAFAFDGDGDRVLAIDDRGLLVDGDALIAILAGDLAERGMLAGNTVVVTTWSNLGLLKAMAARGIDVAQTEVGDKYILELLDQRSLSLGGEQSGHIILRDRTTTGDGM